MKAVLSFSNELNASFMRLTARRIPLGLEKQEIDALRTVTDSALKENSRTLELMKQYNLDGLTDEHKWARLQQNFESEERRGNEAHQTANTRFRMFYPKQLQYIEECVGETIKLGRLLTPVLFSIRKELELPIDETEFRSLYEDAIAKQAESLKEFMRKLNSLIAAQGATPEEPPAPRS
ncbi:MAG: hypothetical protein ACREIJ_01265 [Nitrospiraceae bacterium]